MLGFLFGFNARLGRMHFFLSTIGLAVAMTAVCFVIAMSAVQHAPAGTEPSIEFATWPVIIAIVFFVWITFTLQSMRIRDIGWDPVCVIPAWIALLVVDKVVAGKKSALSPRREHHRTILVSLVQLSLFFVLLVLSTRHHPRPAPTAPTPCT